MSQTLLARKDFTDAIRSRSLWAATVLLTAISSVAVFLPSISIDDVNPATLPQYMLAPVATFVALTALVVGYLAIAGERESGSIRTLLGLPYTRRDVVVGKYLGRSAVVGLAVLVSFVVSGLVAFAVYGSLPVGSFVLLALLTTVLGVAFVGIAVAISAGAASRSRAITLSVGVFILFELLWTGVVQGVYYVVTLGTLPGQQVAPWYFLLKRLSPTNAFSTAAGVFLSDDATRVNVSQGGTSAGESGAVTTLADRVVGEVPVYLDDWFGLVILALWVVVPVLVGYYRFERADLS